MKRVLVVIAIAIALVGGIAWLSQNNSTKSEESESSVSEFSKIEQNIAAGAKLYDVRTAEEYKSGHFENAINFSLQDLEDGKLPQVAKDTKIYVYCHSGNRSSQATVILKKAGYVAVTDLHGVNSVESMGGKLVK